MASCQQVRIIYNASRMICSPENLAERILELPEVYNPNGPHHECKDGGHGHKVDTSVDKIHQRVGIPTLIISIANGGHPWADAIGEALGPETTVLRTEKNGHDQAVLNFAARCALRHARPDEIVLVDDLGTTGASVMPVYKQINFGSRLRHRIPTQAVFYIATRKSYLTHLKRNMVPYDSAVDLNLPTFRDEEQCLSRDDGLCRNGVELIKRPKK